LDAEAAPLATRERVEVHARVKTGSVEEVLLSILSRDETESPVLDQFLDCPCRHRTLLFSKASRERTGPFEKIRPRRTSPGYRGRNYITTRFEALRSQQRDSRQRRDGSRKLQGGPLFFA